MAGYKIFKANSYGDSSSQVSDLGITIDNSSITFSDGKHVSITNPGSSSGAGFWFVADEDAHLFIMFRTDIVDNIFFKNKNTDGSQPMPLLLVTENIEGSLISYSGVQLDNENMMAHFNIPRLTYNTNHDPSKTEITLYPLVGGFVYGTPFIVPATFKTLFVNYYRYFNFGDIIVDSNNNRYIAMGWILHKIGGNNNG